MRVLVVSDTVGALSSLTAGRALASGWAKAEVTVVPAGESGTSFVRAWAEQHDAEVVESAAGDQLLTVAVAGPSAAVGVHGPPTTQGGIAYAASSRPLGETLAALLPGAVRRVHLDLAGSRVHDGGAGLLAALGATADRPLDLGVQALTGLTRLDLDPVRRALADVELVGVVPTDQLAQPLLGLRGITSLLGRDAGTPAEVLLATDAALEQLASLAAPTAAAQPGAGACGGLGFAVLALGGRLTTGPAVALGAAPGGAARGTDLVVTGCSVFDFHSRGGGVVAAAAEAAATWLSPCVVVAGEVVIGGREMRTMGIEAAYAVRESSLDAAGAVDITESELAGTAERVARSWSW